MLAQIDTPATTLQEAIRRINALCHYYAPEFEEHARQMEERIAYLRSKYSSSEPLANDIRDRISDEARAFADDILPDGAIIHHWENMFAKVKIASKFLENASTNTAFTTIKLDLSATIDDMIATRDSSDIEIDKKAVAICKDIQHILKELTRDDMLKVGKIRVLDR
jgi:hypothetical protein